MSGAYLRLGWEFDNGTAYAWHTGNSQQQEEYYATYFQQIVTTMRAVSGANFKYVWNPDGFAFLGLYNNTDPTNPDFTGTYYNVSYAWPGASYVTDIGLDLYDNSGWATASASYANYIAPQLAEAAEFASSVSYGDGTPLAFPEWGVCQVEIAGAGTSCQGDDPTYINNMSTFMTTGANNVAWESYFNVNELLWNSAIGSFPNSLAAFKSDFG